MVLNDLKNLAWRIAEMERNEHPCRQKASLVRMPAWGEALLGGKLAAGSLVELLSAEEGAGAWTLALFMARYACGQRKVLVIADAERRFYPPAASRLHIDLRRTIVIRPQERKTVLTAMTQSLRCAAVGAAIGKVDRLSSTDCRRLQVAAESGGGVGFLLRPAAALSTPSFATVRLLVAPVPVFECFRSGIRQPEILANSATVMATSPSTAVSPSRHIQVEVVRFRGGKVDQSPFAPDGEEQLKIDNCQFSIVNSKPGRSPLVLEIDDEKGHVRLPPGVADAKSPSSSARASG
jgi:protein ImuA